MIRTKETHLQTTVYMYVKTHQKTIMLLRDYLSGLLHLPVSGHCSREANSSLDEDSRQHVHSRETIRFSRVERAHRVGHCLLYWGTARQMLVR